MWLEPIPIVLREMALQKLSEGSVVGFLALAPNRYSLALTWFNCSALQQMGLYEAMLLEAFTAASVNNAGWTIRELKLMFSAAEKELLRSLGEPLPSIGPFRLYRGISGRTGHRRIAGLSWSSSLECACWFATRYASLPKPEVYSIRAAEEDVYAYLHSTHRNEHEFIVAPSRSPQRVSLSEKVMREHAETWATQRRIAGPRCDSANAV